MKHARPDYNRIQDPAGLIPDDEPVFLLRGQDMLAPGLLVQYADRLRRSGCGDPKMVAMIRQHAGAMIKWQREHGGGKMADLPKDAPISGAEMREAFAEAVGGPLPGDKRSSPADLAARLRALASHRANLDALRKLVDIIAPASNEPAWLAESDMFGGDLSFPFKMMPGQSLLYEGELYYAEREMEFKKTTDVLIWIVNVNRAKRLALGHSV